MSSEHVYDVIIVGGGPAGLTAGLYAARGGMKALLLEGASVPPEASLTEKIENYPGFPEGVGGAEFVERLKTQASNFGLEIDFEDAIGLEAVDIKGVSGWSVACKNKKYDTKTVIIASGSIPKTLGTPGEDIFKGKGVSYCATCDGPLFKGKEVVVVGGGDAAIEEALFLAKFAAKITIVHRRDALRAAKVLQERAFAERKIEFAWESVVTAIQGDKTVKSAKIKNIKTNAEKNIPCDGVFVYVGFNPNTGFLKGTLKLNEDGYVIADESMNTGAPGVFACGDCRQKLLRQVITACADGAIAAVSARLYLEALKAS
ncbi:MAG: thioredoxin-disulfide reductase [Candidatus Omnitrophota bacterium]